MGIIPVLSLLSALLAVSMTSDEPAMGIQAACAPTRRRCDSGWTLLAGRCFRFFNSRRTWTLAEAYCVSQRGHLASIHNINEARLVGRLSGNRNWAWIGGGGAMKGHTWYWSDGTPFDYTNWKEWEPNNHGGNEHCINTNFGGGGIWNDLPCNQARPFVCAK
ncbi:galactose-specific lectin nattectin-like [Engraulis encrasicolus]|uniref:galactose-specific lectin nattectin-like n=1 Tax=Engraulis encrasicolus TaxID=184585 RepID=UPI002FCF5972